MIRLVYRLGVIMPVLVLALLLTGALSPRRGTAAMQVPDCLVGTWEEDIGETFTRMNEFLRQIGAASEVWNITGITGGTLLMIMPDGSYEIRYERLSLTFDAAGFSGAFVFDGVGRGTIRETSPGFLIATMAESTLTLSVNSVGLTYTIPVGGPFPQTESEPVLYTCDERQLRMYLPAFSSSSTFLASFARR